MSDSPSTSERLLAGERRALGQMISWAEDGDPRFPAALAEIYGRVGRSWRVGITGPPGAGKSTLASRLMRLHRAAGESVGVLAVDPTSPISGGALLGDRIRMDDLTGDDGVFIRSMASRGGHGGLARAAADACDVMDAFGFDRLLLETVGVGQAEFDVVSATDSVVVVLCPGAGDGIQAMKAGILEVADVLVVNKSDLPGADRLVLDLEEAVHTRGIRKGEGEWQTPVVACAAGRGEGVEAVGDAVEEHRAHLSAGDLTTARARKRVEHVRRVVDDLLDEAIWGEGRRGDGVEAALRGGATPYDVARTVVASVLSGQTSAAPETRT